MAPIIIKFSFFILLFILSIACVAPLDLFSGLNIWIEREQVLEIMDYVNYRRNTIAAMSCPKLNIRRKKWNTIIPKEIYVVSNGLVTFISINITEKYKRYPIPAQIEVIRARWKSDYPGISYYIKNWSSNESIMHNPLMNISPTGFVPVESSSMAIILPCTGKAKGKVQIDLWFQFVSDLNNFQASLAFFVTFYKICLLTNQRKKLDIKCRCKKECIRSWRKFRRMRRKRCIRKCRKELRRQL